MEVTTGERDPGWAPAFVHLGLLFLTAIFPFAIVMMAGSNLRYGAGGVIRLRRLFVASFMTLGFLALFAIAGTTRISPDPNASWWPLFLIPGATIEVLLVALINRKSLDTSSASNLRITYVAYFMLGWTFTFGTAFFGFVLVFITGRLEPFWVALAFTLVGAIINAPTRASLVRRQADIARQGSDLSLLDILAENA